jgi:hypothetical protein
MRDIAARYHELTVALNAERAAANGGFTVKDEARYAQALDACWHKMSRSEQEEAARMFSMQRNGDVLEHSPLGAPEDTVSMTQPVKVEWVTI